MHVYRYANATNHDPSLFTQFSIFVITSPTSSNYSRTSLSRTLISNYRLSRSENLRSNFSSFPHYFIYIFYIYISNFRRQIKYSFVKCGCSIYCFPLSLSTLICRGKDISKYFSESFGIRDNKSRLYLKVYRIYRAYTIP